MCSREAKVNSIRFAQRVFTAAGIYGVLVLAPQYFLEAQVGVQDPPPITHPEFFYGFNGCALAWQLAFLVMGRDPVRFRPLIPCAVVEKWSFGVATWILVAQGRLSLVTTIFGTIDFVLGCLFIAAWRATPSREIAT
jgi:hypothetical protein